MDAIQEAAGIGIKFFARSAPDLLIGAAHIAYPLFVEFMDVEDRLDGLGKLVQLECLRTRVGDIAVDADPLDDRSGRVDDRDCTGRIKPPISIVASNAMFEFERGF